MMAEGWLLVAATIVCVAAALGAGGACKRRARADDWMPGELVDHRLVYSEKTFRSSGDTQLVARVDRAYRNRGGLITLVELKARSTDRVHRSDIIELSAQRVALASETGETVSGIAWIVVESEAGRTVHRVRLMSSDAVMNLASRRDALLAGKAPPEYPATNGLCGTCAYRRRCHPRTEEL